MTGIQGFHNCHNQRRKTSKKYALVGFPIKWIFKEDWTVVKTEMKEESSSEPCILVQVRITVKTFHQTKHRTSRILSAFRRTGEPHHVPSQNRRLGISQAFYKEETQYTSWITRNIPRKRLWNQISLEWAWVFLSGICPWPTGFWDEVNAQSELQSLRLCKWHLRTKKRLSILSLLCSTPFPRILGAKSKSFCYSWTTKIRQKNSISVSTCSVRRLSRPLHPEVRHEY